MVKRLSLALVFVTVGLVAGIVLTGRMRSAEVAVAQSGRGDSPEPGVEQPRAVGATAAPGPDFTRIAEQTVRAVANISSIQVVRTRTSPFFNDPFFQQFFSDPDGMFGSRDRYASSLGSGVIVSPDGYVLTNNHVLGQGSIERVTVSLGDKREIEAKIVGVDSWTDLALLKVSATNLPVIPWGDSSRLKVAEWVMAIGNPYQLSQSVSLGIVSALGRSNVGISTYEDFIQTDAAINPGQLRRRARERPRRADRHQHRDLHAERRLPGHRLRRPEQPRPPHRRRAEEPTAACAAARSAISKSRR